MLRSLRGHTRQCKSHWHAACSHLVPHRVNVPVWPMQCNPSRLEPNRGERESTASQGGAQHHLVYATVCTRLCVVGCVRVLHKHRVSLCITSSSHLDCASGRTSCRLLATRPPTQTAFCVRRQHPASPDVPHTIITPDSIDLAQPDAVAQSSSQRRSYVASNYSTCKPNPFLPIRRRWSCRPAAQPSLL